MTETCIGPERLDDTQILAHLDGVGDRHSTAHLKACAACRARARRLQGLEQSLATSLYRVTCPTPMELGEYHLGALKRRQARAIMGHIDGCPQCGREIARLEGFLGDLAPAPKPNLLEEAAEQIRVQIARLANGVTSLWMPQPALAPVHAGVRGGGHEPAIYDIAGGADGEQVILTAQPRPAAAGRYDLLGLVAGADLTGFTAHLWQGGMPACPAAGTPAGGQAVQPCDQPAPQLVASAPVDEGGNILFTDLAAAEYELVLSGPGRQIYIEKLRI